MAVRLQFVGINLNAARIATIPFTNPVVVSTVRRAGECVAGKAAAASPNYSGTLKASWYTSTQNGASGYGVVVRNNARIRPNIDKKTGKAFPTYAAGAGSLYAGFVFTGSQTGRGRIKSPGPVDFFEDAGSCVGG